MKKEETNPMMKKSGIWLWVLCAPAALVISASHEANKAIKKREMKKAKRDAAFRQKYPEWWFFSD